MAVSIIFNPFHLKFGTDRANPFLAGCATSMPRKDDPWEHFNRQMFGLTRPWTKSRSDRPQKPTANSPQPGFVVSS